MKKPVWQLMAVIMVAAMILTACAPAAQPTAAPTAPAAAAVATDPLTEALAGKYKGTVVTMAGPFTDNDSVKFNDSGQRFFETKTGIDIQYEGSKEFEASIAIRVDGGNPPDVVDFPQPGLLGNFVKKGKVIDVSTFLPNGQSESQLQPVLAGYGYHAGPQWPHHGWRVGTCEW